MKGVALSILVMGVSLAAIIIAYVMFGHIGPSFSSERINVQQAELRKDYGLPVQEVIRNQSVLLTPPSLRDLNQTATPSGEVLVTNKSSYPYDFVKFHTL